VYDWIKKTSRKLSAAREYLQYYFSSKRTKRESADKILYELSLSDSLPSFSGKVLVDAMWDNPNYWLRYTLLRRALNFDSVHEHAVYGPYAIKKIKKTLKTLNINSVGQFEKFYPDKNIIFKIVDDLIDGLKSSEEILKWTLPFNWPADLVYDGILKQQVLASVDIHDPYLKKYMYDAIGSIYAAKKIIEDVKPNLIVLSHAIQFRYSALAWQGFINKIPTVVLFGNLGVPRFFKINNRDDFYDWMDAPNGNDLASVSTRIVTAQKKIGQEYLNKRLSGETADIGAVYAYQKNYEKYEKEKVIKQYGWANDKPIVAVYTANWFDYPHAFGMSNFSDFYDWLIITLKAAIDNTEVNWLFKSHPIDQRYGGVRLKDLMPSENIGNVRMVPEKWNSNVVLDVADAVITYHGTAAIEFAALGKPAMIADRGWYHDTGIALWAKSRNEYIEYLSSFWWQGMDLKNAKEKAEQFSGWYYCCPKWQKPFIQKDDSVQSDIYEGFDEYINNSIVPIKKEINTIKEWYQSNERLYHTYKMKKTSEYMLSNLKDE
jgi:hypothetical protein